MFSKLKSLFRRGMINIIGSPDLFAALDVEVPISQKMKDAIELWSAMHENRAPWLDENTHSLNLAATVACELARLVTIEMQSGLTGSARATYLDKPWQKVVQDARVFAEFASARGDVVLKPYLTGSSVAVQWVNPGDHYSLAFDSNGMSTSELFLDTKVRDGKRYVRGEVQELVGNALRITNKVVVSDVGQENYRPSSLDKVDEWKNITPSAAFENIDRPLWGYFKMPFANTVDPASPLGVSAYAKAVDLIQEADKQYSRLLWEMESGERALFVDSTAFQKDRRGNSIIPHKRLYKALDIVKGANGNESLFEDWTPTLREQSIINGLNEILAKIEDVCGLARGTLCSEPAVEARTATEIKILQQRTFATVTDTQRALQSALEHLAYAMDVWATIGGLAAPGRVEPSFEFDDSVITDRDADFARLERLVIHGMKPEFLFGWQFNLPTETPEDLAAIHEKYMTPQADYE